MKNYISLSAWPPGLLSSLNYHLTQLSHPILQYLWCRCIVLQKINLQLKTQGLNCVGYEGKRKQWRPKEVMVWCEPLPCTGILGSSRNVSKLHALLMMLFVPPSVSPWPVTSHRLWHKSQCYFITECCHVKDKTYCSPHFAVSPFLPSSLSHVIHRLHSFHLSSGGHLSAVISHAYGCRSQGRLNTIHPPDAANHHPVPKPLRATGSRKIQHLWWVATPTLRCCHVMFKLKAAASHALSQ